MLFYDCRDAKPTCGCTVARFDKIIEPGATSPVRTDAGYSVHRVRWPVFEGVNGEGLLLRPAAAPRATIIVVPDADELLYELEHYIYHTGYGPTNETLGKFQESAKGDLEKRQESIKTLVKPLEEQLKVYQQRLQQSETAHETSHEASSTGPMMRAQSVIILNPPGTE